MFSPWPLLPAAAICIVYLAPALKSRHWSANKRFNNPSCFMAARDTGDPALLGIPSMFLFDSDFTHTSAPNARLDFFSLWEPPSKSTPKNHFFGPKFFVWPHMSIMKDFRWGGRKIFFRGTKSIWRIVKCVHKFSTLHHNCIENLKTMKTTCNIFLHPTL